MGQLLKTIGACVMMMTKQLKKLKYKCNKQKSCKLCKIKKICQDMETLTGMPIIKFKEKNERK